MEDCVDAAEIVEEPRLTWMVDPSRVAWMMLGGVMRPATEAVVGIEVKVGVVRPETVAVVGIGV